MFLGFNNLRHFAKSKGRLLRFCCLLKSNIFFTVSVTLFGFSFSRISLLSTDFLISVNSSLKCFIILLLLIWLSSFKAFVKDYGEKYYLNLWLFIFVSSFLNSFRDLSRNFIGDVFLLLLGVSNTIWFRYWFR